LFSFSKPVHSLLYYDNLNAHSTFNNSSVISWWSAEYAEKTTDLSQVTDTLYHIVLSRVSLVIAGFELTTLVLMWFSPRTLLTTTILLNYC
jgi:ABC-type microcin C transport system permease subunit YejB